MNVHKFSVKPRIPSLQSGPSLYRSPKTIHWRLAPNLKHPPIKVNPVTWEIFSQEEITLSLGQVFPMQLGLGFASSKGIVLTLLAYSLRFKKCGSQNEISIGDVENILVTITNNSKVTVKIKENKLLCHVYYHFKKISLI